MSNPFLPKWEYIPDGEPRVFGDRVYIYGSHDNARSKSFCDFKLKVWSAPIKDLSNWTCHGHIFHTKDDRDHQSDVTYANHELFAPDVVKKGDKYYLYAYIVNEKGCVAVSDKPEGPFEFLSTYEYNIEDHYDDGTFIDPGVLVDDDGRVFVYCGYLGSYMCELDGGNMYKVIDGSYQLDIIPTEEPFNFFEGCSMRKIGDTYYFIYSPKTGSQLVYATSKSPTGPFDYRGVIVDNGQDYPGGNNHGSICQIGEQWYIFYHRTTNGTVMSRRACVEKINIEEDGSIKQVEMTSLGFEESLNPYEIVTADTACVIKGDAFVAEKNIFDRSITNIHHGSVLGWKYFDFGEDFSSKTMIFNMKVKGRGYESKVKVLVDSIEGREIGSLEVGSDDGFYSGILESVTGRHALYLVMEDLGEGFFNDMFKKHELFELCAFVFEK